MESPTLYILLCEGDSIKDGIVLSNLDYDIGQACKRAEATKLSHTIYKLVPVYRIKVTYSYPVEDFSKS